MAFSASEYMKLREQRLSGTTAQSGQPAAADDFTSKYMALRQERIVKNVQTEVDQRYQSQLDSYRQSLQGVLDGYDKTAHSAEAKAGWEDYLAVQKRQSESKQQTEDNKTWIEKLIGYLGNSQDTSLPLHMTSEVTKGVQEQEKKLNYPTDDWNEDQQLTFGYLWKTNRQKAWEYGRLVNTERNRQVEQTKLQKIQNAATDSLGAGVGHTVGAILSAPLALADTMGDMIEMGALGHLSDADGEITPGEYSEAVKSGVSQHLNEKGGTLSEDIPVVGGKGWGDVYNLGTSVAQSMLAAHTGGGGQALIASFGPAVQSGINSAKSRGATDEQATSFGLMSGLAEALAELVGVDNLLKIDSANTMKELAINILKQGAAEGLEEGITSVATNFADQLVMADKSEYNIAVIMYMANGMSKEDAQKQAWLDMAEGILFDMLAGFASGSVSGGLETGLKNAVSSPQNTTTQTDVTQPKAPQSTLTDLVDEAIAHATNAPTDPLGAAMEGFKATGSVTNNRARDILNNTKAITQLIQQTGIELPDTASGRRAAVKEAIAQLVQQAQSGVQVSVLPNGENNTGAQNMPATETPAPQGQAYADALLNELIPTKPTQQAVDTTQNTDYDNKNDSGGTPYGTGKETLSPYPGGDGEVASGGRQTRPGSDGFRSAIRGREETTTPTAVRPTVAEGPLTTSQERYTEEDYFIPEPGTPLERAQQATLEEYGVASRVIKQSSWKEKGPAAAHGGIIYFCETIDAEDLPEAIVHELVHLMKQAGYQPYLDIVQITPDRVDLQNPASHALLKDVADHRSIDYFSMDDFQLRTLYDELNAAVYGAYKSGQLEKAENRAMLEGVFPNLDAHLADLDAIFNQFKADRTPTSSVGAAPADFTGKASYNDLLYEGNVQPDRPGDVRPMEVPKTDSYGRHVSETAANLYGAEITPDETASRIEELIAMGALGFDTKTNKQMVEEAAAAIKKNGVAATEKAVTKAVFSGRAQDSDIVKAALLYTTYANRKGDAAQGRAAELAVDLATMANDAGRRLQLFKLIRKMTPQGQLMAVQKGVQRSVERINKGRGKNNQADVTIPQELVDEYLDAAQRDIQEQTEETAREKETIEQAIYKAAAAQIKASPTEKLNAWRYMAMLGNAKTQVRNIFGNAAFRPMTSVKRAVGAVIEQFAVEQENRTKAILGTGQDAKALLKWAQEDAKSQDAQQALSYSAQTGDAARDAIQNERQIFDTEWLETVRKTVQEVPEYFDMVFKKREYAYSLASFVKARGYTSADITSNAVPTDVLNAARSYATQEALKATFNDHNVFSDLLSRLRYRGNNAFGKAANILGEGVLPFRRTPANILVRGLEYSPANVVRSAWNLSTKVRTGEMSAATAIDQMASGLTGTAAMALGYALASGIFGIRLRGKIEDEDEKRTGHQEYALEIGDKSYTIDWLAPVNIPLFVGANIYETNQQSDASWLSSVINASGSSLEPMLELSCLNSLNDLFESAKYAEEGTELWSAVASAATSYMTQFLPTLFGQVEQATEAEKQSAYSSAATPVERSIEKTIGRMTQRIPVLDLFQAKKYDAWGNEVETSSAYQSFINPAYSSEITNDPVDQEISRLNKAQDKNVSPSLPSQSISYTGIDGQTHKNQRLTADEYEQMCRVQGQTQKRLVEDLIDSTDYASLSDADKVKAISYAYDYARDTARLEVFSDYPGYSSKWMFEITGNEAEAILRQAAVGTTERYADLPISTATYVDDLLKSLRPEDGHASVRTIQKMEAVVADDGLTSYVDDLLRDIMPDSTEAKYDKAIDRGFTAEQFVEGYRQYLDPTGEDKRLSVIRYCQREMGMSYAAAKKLYEIYNSKATDE